VKTWREKREKEDSLEVREERRKRRNEVDKIRKREGRVRLRVVRTRGSRMEKKNVRHTGRLSLPLVNKDL